MFYKDGEGAIHKISVDSDIIDFCEQLRTHRTVEVYVDSSDVTHFQKLPEVLLGDNDIDSNTSCEGSTDDEELLVEAPFMTHNSDADEETEEAREKLRRYVQLKKTIDGRDNEGHKEDGAAEEHIGGEESPSAKTVRGNNYVVKSYEATHSCLLGTTTNRRVTAHVVAKWFGEVISGMPFIRPRHLKAMVRRELGVFISSKNTHDSHQAEPSQAGNVASSKVKKKRTEPVNTHVAASRKTVSHQVAASSISTNHQVDAPPPTNAANLGDKEKRKTKAAWRADCSMSVFRGAHTGEAIVGRVVSQYTPFITGSQLESIIAKRREERMKAQCEQLSKQASASVECPELLT
ncbi:hypothetical protein J5N97_020089 [Dioscorea zingiberensis]|uniref:Uncharacterized protein n=1 Tax=Dioscorea zingiberensis TaxID=325984 RepID=A0A9D5CHA9_9LILI|nr:hypothetical protein J5N97_020089 [Dioscorea zingiberensis]